MLNLKPTMALLTTLLALLSPLATASVIIIPGGEPRVFYQAPLAAKSANDLLRNSAPNEFFNSSAEILMSTYSATNFGQSDLFASSDSFVRGSIQAWSQHLHLVIRPDEVWFTILTQMNFYMQSHAEQVRDIFVSHKGQQTIYIEDTNWYSVLFQFQFEIQKRVKTDWLLKWIQPNFSTTTQDDLMTSNILMMGLMKQYFRYAGGIICGLPSVTLLGELSDWEALLAKLDRLPDFGPGPAEYKQRLLPVLSRFVSSYKNPDSRETRSFWNQIVRSSRSGTCGAPPVMITGWITAFFFWNGEGRDFARGSSSSSVELDGYRYPWLDPSELPIGYAGAPFTMMDYGGMGKFPAYVVAGTLGKRIRKGAPREYEEGLKRVNGSSKYLTNQTEHGTLQPLSGWMLYGPVDPKTSNSVNRDDEMGRFGIGC